MAVLDAGTAAHQLQVVDHYQRQTTVTRLQPPCFGANLHDGHPRVVVEVERHAVDAVDRAADLGPVGFSQSAGAQLLRFDFRLAGEDALCQFGVTHFEREHEHRLMRCLRHMRRDAKAKCRLTDRRASTNDVQRTRLQTGQQLVEIVEPGGDAGDDVATLERLLQLVHCDRQQVGQWSRRVDDAILGNLKNFRLGLIERLSDVVGLHVRNLGDLASDTDQSAQHRRVLHDLGVARRVGDRRRCVLQLEQRLPTADFIEQAIAAQLVGDSDDVDRLTGLHQPANRRVYVLMRRLVKVLYLQPEFRHLADDLARQQQRTEQTLLGVQVVRRNTTRGGATRIVCVARVS